MRKTGITIPNQKLTNSQGKIHYHKLGRTKLWKEIFATTNIRLLTVDDLF